jgi:hypothetical protein
MNIHISLNSFGPEVAEIKRKFNDYLNSKFPELPDESQDIVFSVSAKDEKIN